MNFYLFFFFDNAKFSIELVLSSITNNKFCSSLLYLLCHILNI